jgi:hypothetical protein
VKGTGYAMMYSYSQAISRVDVEFMPDVSETLSLSLPIVNW